MTTTIPTAHLVNDAQRAWGLVEVTGQPRSAYIDRAGAVRHRTAGGNWVWSNGQIAATFAPSATATANAEADAYVEAYDRAASEQAMAETRERAAERERLEVRIAETEAYAEADDRRIAELAAQEEADAAQAAQELAVAEHERREHAAALAVQEAYAEDTARKLSARGGRYVGERVGMQDADEAHPLGTVTRVEGDDLFDNEVVVTWDGQDGGAVQIVHGPRLFPADRITHGFAMPSGETDGPAAINQRSAAPAPGSWRLGQSWARKDGDMVTIVETGLGEPTYDGRRADDRLIGALGRTDAERVVAAINQALARTWGES